ncbi:kinase [Thraustotheca clavata]|uniref:Kinase n=1 Tax=Thraustotheca clavata TaxID=74557 RepID=A0A1W0ABL6_9STRA|nr:kinase [Thraustotheca clavata]
MEWVRELTHSKRSSVHLYRLMHSFVAVKHVDAKRVYLRGENDEFAEPRVHRILSKANHPNIVELYGERSLNDGTIELIMEYCPEGSLFDVLSAMPNQQFPTEIARVFFQQIVAGVAYMHGEGYAHRDLSLENILVDSNHVCKIADFGDVIGVDHVCTDRAGKLFYMAPEVYNGEYYIPGEADIWSLGVMLFTMLTGHPLFFKADESDPNYSILISDGFDALVQKLGMALPSMEMDIIEQMLEIDPEERITIEELITHEYIAQTSRITATPAVRSPSKAIRHQRGYRYHPYDVRTNAAKHKRLEKFEAIMFNIL